MNLMTEFSQPFPLIQLSLLSASGFCFCLYFQSLNSWSPTRIWLPFLFLPPCAYFILKQESTDLSYKGPDSINFRVCQPFQSPLLLLSGAVVVWNQCRQYLNLVLIKVYLWTPIFEFHIMFMWHKIFFAM